MIVGYAQKCMVDEAAKLFDEIPERNLVSCTSVILGYAQNGCVGEAYTRAFWSNPPHRKDVGPVQLELHMDVFRNLSSVNARIREAATLTLVQELQEVQMVYEQSGTKGNMEI